MIIHRAAMSIPLWFYAASFLLAFTLYGMAMLYASVKKGSPIKLPMLLCSGLAWGAIGLITKIVFFSQFDIPAWMSTTHPWAAFFLLFTWPLFIREVGQKDMQVSWGSVLMLLNAGVLLLPLVGLMYT